MKATKGLIKIIAEIRDFIRESNEIKREMIEIEKKKLENQEVAKSIFENSSILDEFNKEFKEVGNNPLVDVDNKDVFNMSGEEILGIIGGAEEGIIVLPGDVPIEKKEGRIFSVDGDYELCPKCLMWNSKGNLKCCSNNPLKRIRNEGVDLQRAVCYIDEVVKYLSNIKSNDIKKEKEMAIEQRITSG